MSLNYFLIFMVISMSSSAFAGREGGTGGGGTVVYLQQCKRPILLDIFLYKAKNTPSNVCDDDGPAGFTAEHMIGQSFKENTTEPLPLNGDKVIFELDTLNKSQNYELNLSTLPLRYRGIMTIKDYSAYLSEYLKNILKAPVNFASPGFAILDYVVSENLYTHQKFNLDAVSYYDDIKLKRKYRDIKYEHVAVTMPKIRGRDTAFPLRWASGYWADGSLLTDLVINIEIWNKLSLKSQFALLLHEGLRYFQYQYGEHIGDMQTKPKSYLRPAVNMKNISPAEWDELITKNIGAIVESGNLSSDFTSELKLFSENAFQFMAYYGGTLNESNSFNAGHESTETYKAIQNYLLKLVNNEPSDDEWQGVMASIHSTGFLGQFTLIRLMNLLGANQDQVAELHSRNNQFYKYDSERALPEMFANLSIEQSFLKIVIDTKTRYSFSIDDYENLFRYRNFDLYKLMTFDFVNTRPLEFWGGYVTAGCPSQFSPILNNLSLNDESYTAAINFLSAFCPLSINQIFIAKHGDNWMSNLKYSAPVENAIELGQRDVVNFYLQKLLSAKKASSLKRVAIAAVRAANVPVLKELAKNGFNIKSIESVKIIKFSAAILDDANKINELLTFLREHNVSLKLQAIYGSSTFYSE